MSADATFYFHDFHRYPNYARTAALPFLVTVILPLALLGGATLVWGEGPRNNRTIGRELMELLAVFAFALAVVAAIINAALMAIALLAGSPWAGGWD